MFKKVCVTLIAFSIIASELPCPPQSNKALAAEDRISPQEIAIFALLAGAVFFVITYFVAGWERGHKNAIGVVEEERRTGYIDEHPKLNPDRREAILRGELQVGMGMEEVIASWGEPRRKEILGSTGEVREQWIYYKMINEYTSSTYYLLFVNGFLKKW